MGRCGGDGDAIGDSGDDVVGDGAFVVVVGVVFGVVGEGEDGLVEVGEVFDGVGAIVGGADAAGDERAEVVDGSGDGIGHVGVPVVAGLDVVGDCADLEMVWTVEDAAGGEEAFEGPAPGGEADGVGGDCIGVGGDPCSVEVLLVEGCAWEGVEETDRVGVGGVELVAGFVGCEGLV